MCADWTRTGLRKFPAPPLDELKLKFLDWGAGDLGADELLVLSLIKLTDCASIDIGRSLALPA
jgi:hypothetical protein